MGYEDYIEREANAMTRERRSALEAKVTGRPTAGVEGVKLDHVNVDDPTQCEDKEISSQDAD